MLGEGDSRWRCRVGCLSLQGGLFLVGHPDRSCSDKHSTWHLGNLYEVSFNLAVGIQYRRIGVLDTGLLFS